MTVSAPSGKAPPAASRGVPSEPYGWDWTATTHAGREDVVNDLLSAMGTVIALPGKGLQGWSQSIESYDAGGYLTGRVYLGGGRDDVHVVSTSASADEVRPVVTRLDPEARTARVDTRVDTLVPFADLGALCEEAAASYGSRITRIESSERGVSLGRTIYVGAPSSAVRVRVYEKWLESPGQYVEGTNRVEVQLRPPSRVKADVSAWTPAQTFCASRVTRSLAQLLGDDLAPAATLHVKRGTPDLERTLETMGTQYGNAARRWLDLSGGDLGRLLEHLIDAAPDDGPPSVAPASRR